MDQTGQSGNASILEMNDGEIDDAPYLGDLVQRMGVVRRSIHREPETAFTERRTAAMVADRLETLGVEVHRGIGTTGVVGLLKQGTGPRSIGLRADMDALFTQEENTFPHCSIQAGKFHGCGHDGHTAMLLGAAERLALHGRFDGTVVFIFQPAEENEGGAAAMIAEGLFDRFDVDAVYAIHNGPGLPLGSFAICPGPIMAAFDKFEITVTGSGTHAGIPHGGIDPIVVASELVSALQTVVSRTIDPVDRAVVSVTQIHSGDTWNVIPERAVIRGCTRSLGAGVRDGVERAMRRIADGVCAAHGARATFWFKRCYPATVNTPVETANAVAAAIDVAGAARVVSDMRPWMTSEDFGFMLECKPGAYMILGNGTDSAMLHNPHYDFNDGAIPTGIAYWTRLVELELPTLPSRGTRP